MNSLYFTDPLYSDCQTEMAKVVQILQEILFLLLIFSTTPGYCKLVLEAARLVIISSFQASCPLSIAYNDHISYVSILIHHSII